MKQLRGRDSTERQDALFSSFMGAETDPVSQRLCDEAFDVVIEIDALKEKLEIETDEKERKRIDKLLRGLENKITPVAKRAAIAREPMLSRTVLRYFREFNGDTNISRCIRWVRAQGVGKSMQDAAMRTRIKRVFGIIGERGRPRGS
jgi:hypothetical protein